MSALLAGLVVLVIGDSHLTQKNFLIDPLYNDLTEKGATVYMYGYCGARPEDYLIKRSTYCGRASRVPGKSAVVDSASSVPSWNIQTLIAEAKPNLVVVEIGDAIGNYKQKQLQKPWLTEQVTSLTAVLKSHHLACDWVGPPWGTEGGSFGKTYKRVREVSDFLSKIVSPCTYIDSTQFAKPGQWKTLDGQHMMTAGYRAWAKAIADAVANAPIKAPARTTAADLIGP